MFPNRWQEESNKHIELLQDMIKGLRAEIEILKQANKNDLLPLVMPSLLDLDFKQMRKAKGLTLRQVEESTGISNAYLSQLETGKIKSPGYDTVKALYELYSNEA